MYRSENYYMKVHIDLEPGVYVFPHASASVKTYLAHILEKYRRYGEPVRAYSYSDFCDGVPIDSVLDGGKYRVVMLDRYSLYYGAGADAIKTFAQKSILLVDCKQVFDVCGHKTCLLYRTEELLEVSL